MNPTDAKTLAVVDGETVQIESRWGEAKLPIEISDAIKPGEVFATFHTPRIFLNRVTSAYRDRHVQSPEYKVTAVQIRKLAREPA